jgi:uncharacterized protein YaiL (DUF2058 family)
MSLSLREQLLAAGLGTKKQAKQIEQQQGRETWRNREGPAAAEQKRAAVHAQAQAAKATRDQELSRKRQEEAERRARWAQIKQLVEQNVIARPECEEGFNFIDRGKVRRIYVNAELRERIVSGVVVIVRCEGRYHLVPAETAARIGEREPRAVVSLSQKASETAEDDPYKEFAVPDDLKW